MTISKEGLEKLVTQAPNTSNVEWLSEDGRFSRKLQFYVKNKKYIAEWWTNQCYLYFDEDAMFMFNNIRICSTWPNRYKANMQFYDSKSEVVAVIPLEEYLRSEE